MRIELDVIDPTVECSDCGLCCSTMRTPPHMVLYYADGEVNHDASDEDDLAWLLAAPEEARRVRDEGCDGDRPDGSPCSWLDPVTKSCRFYEHRPGICRDFSVGGIGCLTWRRES